MMTVKFPRNVRLSQELPFYQGDYEPSRKKDSLNIFCYTSFYYFNYKQTPFQMFFLTKIMEILKINAVDDASRGDVCCQLPFKKAADFTIMLFGNKS